MQTIIEKHFKFNYNTIVKRVKWRTNGNEADAEDVVMEAYVRALRYKDSFEMGNPFNYWFGRIVSNALKDWKREQFNSTLTDEFEEDKSVPSKDTSMHDALIQKIALEIDALEEEEHKEVLRLSLMYGFKLRQVVQITNLKYKTIDQIIQRFKARLKEKHNVPSMA